MNDVLMKLQELESRGIVSKVFETKTGDICFTHANRFHKIHSWELEDAEFYYIVLSDVYGLDPDTNAMQKGGDV